MIFKKLQNVCKTKSTRETEKSAQKFLEHLAVPRQKSIAERAVPRAKQGTSAILLQSGLDEKWWSDSMACYCYLRNMQDLLSDGDTPHERRFGGPFMGPVIPSV